MSLSTSQVTLRHYSLTNFKKQSESVKPSFTSDSSDYYARVAEMDAAIDRSLIEGGRSLRRTGIAIGAMLTFAGILASLLLFNPELFF